MTASIQLTAFCKKFINGFTLEDKKFLTVDGVDYLSVLAPVIVTQSSFKYVGKTIWFKLLLSFIRSIIKVVYLQTKLTRQKFEIESNAKVIFVCNTTLAFREIYIPLLKSSSPGRVIILFTSKKLDIECEYIAKKYELTYCSGKPNFSISNLKGFAKISLALFYYLYRSHGNSVKKKSEKIYLVLHSLFGRLPELSYVFFARQNIKKSKIRAILSDDVNDPSVRYIVEYAKLFKDSHIKSYVVQFGHYDIESVEWTFVNSDKIFAWGNFYKNLFINFFGLNRVEIMSIGSPRFDYLFDIANKIKNPDSFKIITVLSTYAIKSYESNLDNKAIYEIKLSVGKILSDLSKLNNFKVYIKPHPYENSQDIKAWKEFESSDLVILDKQIDVRETLIHSDLVVSFGSGLTLDCLVCKIPVLLPNWISGYPWEYGALISAGGIQIKTKEQFSKRIQMLLGVNFLHEENTRIENFITQNTTVSNLIMQELLV